MYVLWLVSLLLTPVVEETPVGNWKMTIKVGHIGEGLRTVVLAVTEADGGYKGELTSMQNRMTEADEVLFDGKTLTVYYGSYEYVLDIDGDTGTGTVTSPAGKQDVTAERQETQLFAGDEPEPYQKTWRGQIEEHDGSYVIKTRRNTFDFVNADVYEKELTGYLGKGVSITGFWRVDKIEIQTIEPWQGRR